MKIINEANFSEEIRSSGVFLLDIWATWCKPCMLLSKVLDEVDGQVEGVVIGKMNSEENIELCDKLEINALPTMIFFKNGQEVLRTVGMTTNEQIVKNLNDLVSRL